MKYSFLFFMLIGLGLLNAQTPDFSLYGYAAQEGGTTGGAAGDTVVPQNFDELQAYAQGTTPYTILINKEFKGPNVLRMGSNKSLIGVEDKGFINQIGVSIQCQSNIIIQNIKFTMTDVPISNDGENKIEGFRFDPDCISIQADDEDLPEAQRKTHHIWIDHCEFYNEDPNIMTDGDRYDGLVDIKNDVKYVTISWCYFHDHHKGCLSGKGNSDNFDRLTTMHHNRFENISSRLPLLRYGKLHLFNNYINNCPDGNGLNVRINSNAYVENNYYNNVKKPIFGKLSEGGRAHLTGNVFKDCARLPQAHITDLSPNADALSDSETFEDSDYVPAYEYAAGLDSVSSVPQIVTEWSGVNKIPAGYLPPQTTGLNDNLIAQPKVYASGHLIIAQLSTPCTVAIYDLTGTLLYQNRNASGKLDIPMDNSGLYLVSTGTQCTKVFIE